MKTFNKSKLQKAFEKFDKENPKVWEKFETLTFRLINKGIEHYGAKAIWECIRFKHALRTKGGEFKLNNNFTAFYARKFIDKYPQYKGFFELRKRRA